MSFADLPQLLLALSAESKRKHPEVKTASDDAIAAWKADSIASLNQLKQAEDGSQCTLLQPVLLACQTRNAKVIQQALVVLKRLLSSKDAFNQALIPSVLSILRLVSSQAVEIQLSILQILVSLLSNTVIHNELLAETLLLCFKLQESKVGVVSSTAAATLRQLIIILFERVTAEDAQTKQAHSASTDTDATSPGHKLFELSISSHADPIFLKPAAADAYRVLADLCLLVSANPKANEPSFLKLSALPKTFGLELIESVLSDFHAIFQSDHPELLYLLKSSLSPTLIRSLAGDVGVQPQFSVTLRLMRVVYLLLKLFSDHLVTECEIFYQMFIKVIAPGEVDGSGGHPLGISTNPSAPNSQSGVGSSPPWMRVLALELLRGLCNDFDLLRKVWERYDQPKAKAQNDDASQSHTQKEDLGILTGLLSALSRLASEKPNLLGICTSITMGTGSEGATLMGSMAEAAVHATGAAAPPTEFSAETAGIKIQCIDQLDKADPPSIPETYVFFLALQSLTAIANGFYLSSMPLINEEVRRMCSADNSLSPSAPPALTDLADGSVLKTTQAMTAAIWPPLLFSLSFFISTNLSESLFSNVLASTKSFTIVCGLLNLPTPRDAFLSSLCKFAIPPLVVATLSSHDYTGIKTAQTGLLSSGADALGLSATKGTPPGLSVRNLACLASLLFVVDQLAGVLGENWFSILEALQNAEYVLKLSAGVKRKQEESDARAHIDRLFQTTSASLDDVAFSAFLKALTKLSSEMVGLPAQSGKDGESSQLPEIRRRASGISTNRNVRPNETSFGIGKLGDVCSLNIHRLIYRDADVAWNIATLHLLGLQHWPPAPPNTRLQAAETLDVILDKAANTAIGADAEVQLTLQSRLIGALKVQATDVAEFSQGTPSATDIEIRKKAYEALFKLLEGNGHSLLCGWSTILNMLKEACPSNSKTSTEEQPSIANSKSTLLIPVAFPSVQLICNDFLTALSLDEVSLAIHTLMAFALQVEHFNIALTTGALIQQISEYIRSKRDLEPQSDDTRQLAAIWLNLLRQLLSLCRDDRAEIRDGAIKFLFQSLQSHANHLEDEDWKVCLWEILLPLIDQDEVKRNTQSTKTLDDSQVLVLTSASLLIRQHLSSRKVQSPTFPAFIKDLVSKLQRLYLLGRAEVSTSSMTTLNHLATACSPSESTDLPRQAELSHALQEIWLAWRSIGQHLQQIERERQDETATPVFTQSNLQAFVECLAPLCAIEGVKVSLDANKNILSILRTVLTWKHSPEYRPDVDAITPIQAAILGSIRSLDTNVAGVSALVLTNLAQCFTLCFTHPYDPPVNTSTEGRIPINRKITYVALSKAAMPQAIEFFLQKWQVPEIYEQGATEQLLIAYEIPLRLKYECPAPSKYGSDPPLWRTATQQFLITARVIVKSMESLKISSGCKEKLWQALNGCYRAGLMADSSYLAPMPLKQQRAAEDFDLSFLASIELDILPSFRSTAVPTSIIQELASIVQLSSRLYSMDVPVAKKKSWLRRAESNELESDDRRFASSFEISEGTLLNGTTANITETHTERFAYWCFDLLFLVCHAPARLGDKRLATIFLPCLLNRCQFVIETYLADHKIRGKTPFPRIRQEELTYVLSKLLNLELEDGVYAQAFPRHANGTKEIEQSHPQLRQHKHAHILHLFKYLPDLLSLQNVKMSNDKPYRLSGAAVEIVGMPPEEVVRLGRIGTANCEPAQIIKTSIVELSRRMLALVVGLVTI